MSNYSNILIYHLKKLLVKKLFSYFQNAQLHQSDQQNQTCVPQKSSVMQSSPPKRDQIRRHICAQQGTDYQAKTQFSLIIALPANKNFEEKKKSWRFSLKLVSGSPALLIEHRWTRGNMVDFWRFGSCRHAFEYRISLNNLIFCVSGAVLIRGQCLFKRLIPQKQNILIVQFN